LIQDSWSFREQQKEHQLLELKTSSTAEIVNMNLLLNLVNMSSYPRLTEFNFQQRERKEF